MEITVNTKFNIGDEVYTVVGDTPCKKTIESIEILKLSNRTDIVYYHIEDAPYGCIRYPIGFEERCFATRQELIKILDPDESISLEYAREKHNLPYSALHILFFALATDEEMERYYNSTNKRHIVLGESECETQE